MDRLSQVLLVAGFGFFALAFVLSGFYPWWITDGRVPEADWAAVARDVTPEFRLLKEAYPVAFDAAYEGAADALGAEQLAALPPDDARRQASEAAWRDVHAQALRRGRDVYVAEGCWHCHSQYVRPVANEAERFGPVRTAAEDNNVLQRPVLWGTRRVGPDLTHEGGLRSNDWHVAHFWDPQAVTPDTVMPRFRWFLREGWQVRRRIDPDVAQRRGLDPQTVYALPGVHDTEEDARAALEAARARLPSSLAAESERMTVGPGLGPNADGLSLIAYLQWLGTWRPDGVDL